MRETSAIGAAVVGAMLGSAGLTGLVLGGAGLAMPDGVEAAGVAGSRAGSTAGGTAGSRAGMVAGNDVRLRPITVVVPPKTGDLASRAGYVAPVAGSPSRARRLPTFTKSFSWNAKRYSYTTVGTDPAGPAATTTVANVLAPLALTFASGGATVAPAPTVLGVIAGSAVYRPADFPSGRGQYADAFLRSQFLAALAPPSTGSGPLAGVRPPVTKDWHVLLAAPTTARTLTLEVPRSKGTVRWVRGVRTGFVDVDWLDARLQPTVTAAPADVLTQVLAGNVVACKPFRTDLSTCGAAGYHSATTTATGRHTYTYQAWLHPTVLGAASGLHDLGPLTHELGEWATDPFLDNAVPAWRSDEAPQYGCLALLESADPVVGSSRTIGGLTYSDQAYVDWFSRRRPSLAWQGRYSWFGLLKDVSPSCRP